MRHTLFIHIFNIKEQCEDVPEDVPLSVACATGHICPQTTSPSCWIDGPDPAVRTLVWSSPEELRFSGLHDEEAKLLGRGCVQGRGLKEEQASESKVLRT